ncbi:MULTISPECIES: FkbM family methyltransferase [unclassified Streptomyces]|uniref:FkbM family methyltransferase n=1 Tax=unclassified Streptomyces TaxID=2593676 RepID=UPI0038217DFB
MHAFEPHPGNRDVLLKNTRGLANVTVVPCAVSDRVEKRSLHFSSNTGRHSLFPGKFSSVAGATAEVDCVTLDSYWESIGRPRIDLVKIDVEGAEVSVFSRMSELLGASPDIDVISEYYPANLRTAGHDPQEFLDLFARHGLSVETIRDDGSLVPGAPELSGEDYVNVLLRHDRA